MKNKMIRLSYPKIDKKAFKATRNVIKSGYLTQGKVTKDFESAVAEYVGTKHGIATSSCTTALHLSLVALNLKKDDEIIVPDFTFPATANAVIQSGATLRIVDVFQDTFNINLEKLVQAITPKTKAIIVVHVFGLCADMNGVIAIAKQHNLKIIEDAACALGSEYFGLKAGNFGDLNCFSFHPRKVITTGEGGMIVTNDTELNDHIRVLASHGSIKNQESTFKNNFIEFGYNYRLSDLNSAVGLVELNRIEKIVNKRRKIAKRYKNNLNSSELISFQSEPSGYKSNYQSLVVKLASQINRNEVIAKMAESGIQTTLGTYSLVSEPAFKNLEKEPIVISRYLRNSTLSLPIHERLSDYHIDFVSEVLLNILKKNW
jgi:perosamine synthetase